DGKHRARAELSDSCRVHEILGRGRPSRRGHHQPDREGWMKAHFSFGSLRSDHIAGAAFVAFAIVVFALSGDLPFGTLSSPGAGMMPKLLLVLMIAFGIALVIGGAASQPFADIEWTDSAHALMVVVIAGIAITLYQTLGFILTMSLLVFALLIM